MNRINITCGYCGSSKTKLYSKITDYAGIVECIECRRRTSYNIIIHSYSLDIFDFFTSEHLKTELLPYIPNEESLKRIITAKRI